MAQMRVRLFSKIVEISPLRGFWYISLSPLFSPRSISMKKLLAIAAVALIGLSAGCASDSCCGSCCDADETGFVSLFNGKDLTGWTGGVADYSVQDGVIVFKKGGHGNLLTEKEYANFDFRCEFKLEPAANNGVAIRAPADPKGGLSYKGMEIQILDDDGYKATGKPLQDYQHCGSIYGIVPAKQGHVKKPGEWQTMRILAEGPHVQVWLNGELITDGHLDKVTPVDHKDHPGQHNTTGHIGFLGHNDVVYFRNIRVKELK
jgi:hypothetical protein